MLTFDTMKINASLSKTFLDFNPNHVLCRKTIDEQFSKKEDAIQTSTTYKINCKSVLGLSFVDVNPDADNVTIEFSAKILKENYPLLINSNTIIQALEGINQNGCITINPDALLENAFVHKFDCTKDLNDEKYTPAKILDVIGLMTNKSYTVVPYPHGYQITKIAKSNNTLLKFYDKDFEMLLAGNKEIKKYVQNSYINTTRSELCLRKYAQIRSYTGLKGATFRLTDVLNLKTNPIHKFWLDFLNPVPSLFEEYEDSNWIEVVRKEGLKSIIKQLKYNERNILSFMRKLIRGENHMRSIYRHEVKPVMDMMKTNINPDYVNTQRFITQSVLVN